jgi:3-hydroxyisobutyrate dehydrogenase-like beta-hydroxyacid dehydrogenase
MTTHIGFIGLGNMGQAMATNLLKAGFALTVYNRTASKADGLVQQGAQRAERAVDVIERGGIVITMVANDQALEEVISTDGFLEKLGPNGIHLSMSTVSPALAHNMAALHAQHGSSYVAAPVFGRPDAAAARKLWIVVAGAAAAKERVRPVLETLGQGIFDFGEEPEKANIVKICGNFMIVAAMDAMAEALTLAEKNGIDRSAMISMFGQTLFAAPIYQNYGKMIAEKRHTPAGFYLYLGLKDVNLVLDAAEQARMPMPLASLVHDRLLASIAKGRAEMDWSAISLDVLDNAGL